ncbi:zinc ABC transporter substrate-binding protein [bacterium]|nr:zinc ABC transporter substrate-binding protein [bacterium]
MFKNSKHLNLLAVLVFASFILGACQPTAAPNSSIEEGVLTVTVSILPQAYFVERIAGDAVNVNVMVGPGENAHTYEPTPEQMIALENSAIFFSIGVDYEGSWLPRFEEINREMRIVNSASGIDLISITADHDHEGDEDHEADVEDDHDDEGGLDPHVWLSPKNGKIIAENILTALTELLPESADSFRSNADTLFADIDELDAQIQSTLQGAEQRTFMVFHPAWGYFAHDYDLEQVAVQVGGQDPSASEVASLVDTAREHGIKVIFIQTGFSTTDADAIAQDIGGEVVTVDPLAADWLANLQTVAEAFAAALQP